MKQHFLSTSILVTALISISSSDVSACVTKSGKDCDTTAAHKVHYSKKLIKLAPAGGVGATSHAQGFDQLGVPSFAAPPPAQQNFGSNPDGWFYLMPSSQHTGGFVPKPMPHRLLQILSSNSERGGHQGGLIRADGSLTPYAVSIGWARTGAPVPVVVTPQAPVASNVAQPSLVQPQILAPQQVQPATPQIAAPRPNAIRAPNLLPGHAANGANHAHPDQHVDVYHPTKAGVYSYADAHKIGDPSFHLVVIGIKEPE